ncbi:Ycf66 family protein [Geminocystis herdmanii]|uniref:Ycf66 family protein n=1 Tax=Geminocystis herdmanii TaxID=669359 RepID=UPI000347EE9F|nr:Ycf66 family protein [Geminocystis herdmanii]
MVNFGFNAASILGIVLFLAGGALYAMRSWKPEVSKDHDIFFAAVGLLCGGILFFHGWRLDPILQFCQLLLAGSAIFFVIESVRLRAVTSTQVRGRTSSYVDNDRANSRVYRAELDQMEDDYEEEEVPRRRLQGTPPRSTSRRSTYEEEAPRPRRPRPSNYNQEPPVSRSRNNPPSRGNRQYDDWQDTPDHWEDETPTPRRSSSRRPPSDVPPTRRTQKRRPKSADDIVSSVGTQYVDYQPLDVDGENQDYDNSDNSPKPDNFDY